MKLMKLMKPMQQVITEQSSYEELSPSGGEQAEEKREVPALLLERILSRRKPCAPRLAAVVAHSPRGSVSNSQLDLGLDPPALEPRRDWRVEPNEPRTARRKSFLSPRTSSLSSSSQLHEEQLDSPRTAAFPPTTKSSPQLDLDFSDKSTQRRPSFLSPRSTLSPLQRSSSLSPGASLSSPQLNLDVEQLERPGLPLPRSRLSLELTSQGPSTSVSTSGVSPRELPSLRGQPFLGHLQRSGAPGAPSAFKFPLPPESPRPSLRCGPANLSSIDTAAESVYQLLARDPAHFSPLSGTSSIEQQGPLSHSPPPSTNSSPKPSMYRGPPPQTSSVEQPHMSSAPSIFLSRQPSDGPADLTITHDQPSPYSPTSSSPTLSAQHRHPCHHYHHHHQHHSRHHKSHIDATPGAPVTSPPQPPWSKATPIPAMPAPTPANEACVQPMPTVFASAPMQCPSKAVPDAQPNSRLGSLSGAPLAPVPRGSRSQRLGTASSPRVQVAEHAGAAAAAEGVPTQHSSSMNATSTKATTDNTKSPAVLPPLQGPVCQRLPPKPRLPYVPSLNLGALSPRKKQEEAFEEEGGSGMGTQNTQKLSLSPVPSLDLRALSTRKSGEGVGEEGGSGSGTGSRRLGLSPVPSLNLGALSTRKREEGAGEQGSRSAHSSVPV